MPRERRAASLRGAFSSPRPLEGEVSNYRDIIPISPEHLAASNHCTNYVRVIHYVGVIQHAINWVIGYERLAWDFVTADA
jgi:hypothetical protein